MPTLEDLDNAPDPFTLFGLDPRFDLDESALQTRYLQLTRLTHPDFAGSDADAQARAMEVSAKVNEAYRVLSDPEERANSLLRLLGGALKEDDKSLPRGFLEKMMTVREAVADAQLEGDAPALARQEAQAKAERQAHLERITRLFASLRGHDNPVVQNERLRAVRTELNALRYIQRMLEQMGPGHDPIM